MVTSKAGGVAVGGAQGTANAGASEFSGANFTYVKIGDGGTTNWSASAATDTSSTGVSGHNALMCEWMSQKGTIVAFNGTAANMFVIFEGPFGWGDSTAMTNSFKAANPSTVNVSSAGAATVTTALVLA